jgi:tetratricopeptide (TPR) repeat protein
MAVNVAPSTAQTPAASGMGRRRWFLLLGLVVVLLVGSYALAWYSASQLSQGYLRDADASYDEGEYLNALVGYREFDEAQQKYVDRGGYMEVERIWGDRYAQPVPPDVARARQRIDEIVNERLTIADAEAFVQQNIGRSNPYLALLYLRLGELYETDGKRRDARDIYESFADLFPNEVELTARAQQNLERLESE